MTTTVGYISKPISTLIPIHVLRVLSMVYMDKPTYKTAKTFEDWVNSLTPEEMFELWLTWEGIIGYANNIWCTTEALQIYKNEQDFAKGQFGPTETDVPILAPNAIPSSDVPDSDSDSDSLGVPKGVPLFVPAQLDEDQEQILADPKATTDELRSIIADLRGVITGLLIRLG